MELSLYFILILLIFFQSIFGVGLLVFGTPTLIYFYNYSFESTLSILLPCSCFISLYQTFYYNEDIKTFNQNLIKFSIAPLIFFMLLTINFFSLSILKILIPLLLIIISLINILDVKIFINEIIKKKHKTILFFIGAIHGLSNLGGGIISIYASQAYNNYRIVRKIISTTYLTFGTLQIFILAIHSKLSYEIDILFLIIASIPIFFLESFFFRDLNNFIFNKILNTSIFIYGNILVIIYFINVK